MNTSTAAPRPARPHRSRAPRPTRSRRRLATSPPDDGAIDAESVVSGFALLGLLCFVAQLIVGCFVAGFVA